MDSAIWILNFAIWIADFEAELCLSCCHWTLENRFFIVNYGIRIAVHGSWKMDYAVNLVDSAIWILHSVIWIVHSVIWIVHYACGI